MSSTIPVRFSKTIIGLPTVLTPDTVFAVRNGPGIDLYVSDMTGEVAYTPNSPLSIFSQNSGTLPRITSLSFDNASGFSVTDLGSGQALITQELYSLPLASTSTLGGVRVDGSSITVHEGVISASIANYISHSGGITTVTGDLDVTGNINFTGNITAVTGNRGSFFGDVNGFEALYAGIATGYSVLPFTVLQTTASANEYAQINFQNINNGNQSSGDIVVTGGAGTDTTNYIDMGIASGTWDGSQSNSLGTALTANDGYLYTQGASLLIGTTVANTSLKIIVGGSGSEHIVAQVTSSGIELVAGGITFPNTGGTQTYAYTDTRAKELLSVAINSPSNSGSLSYTDGVITFTPPVLSDGSAIVNAATRLIQTQRIMAQMVARGQV